MPELLQYLQGMCKVGVTNVKVNSKPILGGKRAFQEGVWGY